MKLIFIKGLINRFECIIAISDNKVLKRSRVNCIFGMIRRLLNEKIRKETQIKFCKITNMPVPQY